MSLLVEHITAMRQKFIAEHGKPPAILALGRWDARELARFAVTIFDKGAPRPLKGSRLFRDARGGVELYGGTATVRVDGRIGRMPGALWWHADRRN